MPSERPTGDQQARELRTYAFAAMRVLPREALHGTDLRPEVQYDGMLNAILLQLRARVLGRPLGDHDQEHVETVALRTPATWWAHARLAACELPGPLGRLAGWAARRWPPRMHTVRRLVRLHCTAEAAEIFPEQRLIATEALGQGRRVLAGLAQRTDGRWLDPIPWPDEEDPSEDD